MAVRALRHLLLLLLLLALTCQPLVACFGPKLFVGVGAGAEAAVLYAMVTLYVQEKTGVESTRVDFFEGQEPLAELTAEKVDLAFMTTARITPAIVFNLEGFTALATGKRPLDDLQFTTVLPAIRKLNALVQPEDVTALVQQVKAGASAMVVVRKLFMQRRWI